MLEHSVTDAKLKWLTERMISLGIREEDLEERFVRSSGAGGQHVNKTSTCVWLLHRPTGLEVKCMSSRSQALNRFLARRELLEKIAALRGEPTRQEKKAARLRKQKTKRRKRAQEKYGTTNEGSHDVQS